MVHIINKDRQQICISPWLVQAIFLRKLLVDHVIPEIEERAGRGGVEEYSVRLTVPDSFPAEVHGRYEKIALAAWPEGLAKPSVSTVHEGQAVAFGFLQNVDYDIIRAMAPSKKEFSVIILDAGGATSQATRANVSYADRMKLSVAIAGACGDDSPEAGTRGGIVSKIVSLDAKATNVVVEQWVRDCIHERSVEDEALLRRLLCAVEGGCEDDDDVEDLSDEVQVSLRGLGKVFSGYIEKKIELISKVMEDGERPDILVLTGGGNIGFVMVRLLESGLMRRFGEKITILQDQDNVYNSVGACLMDLCRISKGVTFKTADGRFTRQIRDIQEMVDALNGQISVVIVDERCHNLKFENLIGHCEVGKDSGCFPLHIGKEQGRINLTMVAAKGWESAFYSEVHSAIWNILPTMRLQHSPPCMRTVYVGKGIVSAFMSVRCRHRGCKAEPRFFDKTGAACYAHRVSARGQHDEGECDTEGCSGVARFKNKATEEVCCIECLCDMVDWEEIQTLPVRHAWPVEHFRFHT